MSKHFIIAALLFIATSFVIGLVEALWLAELYLGFAYLVLGILLMSNSKRREQFYRSNMKDPVWEKSYSPEAKRLFDTFYFPSRGILAGVALIVLYLGIHQQLFTYVATLLERL